MRKLFGGALMLTTLVLASCWDDSRQPLSAGEFNHFREGGRADG